MIEKIQPRNLIKGTKLSTTPKRVRTVGSFIATKNLNENLLWKTRKITSKVAVVEDEKPKIEQKYLKKKENSDIDIIW